MARASPRQDLTCADVAHPIETYGAADALRTLSADGFREQGAHGGPRGPIGRFVVGDPGDAQGINCGVRETVPDAFEDLQHVVGAACRHLVAEGTMLHGRDERVVGADGCEHSGDDRVGRRSLDGLEAGMERHDRADVRSRTPELECHGATEALAEYGQPADVHMWLIRQHRRPGVRDLEKCRRVGTGAARAER